MRQPTADINVSLTHFSLNLNLLGWEWQPAADNNGCLARFKFLKKHAKWLLLSAAGCHT
jgi:hypothetical protein